MTATAAPEPVDPFDLPDALGTVEVTWCADDGLSGHLVRGTLQPEGADAVPCDLLAVDEAFPAPVADDETRLLAHQAWRHGQVHLVTYADRLTLLVPGRCFSAELVLETLSRLAKALGAPAERYRVLLRLGR